MPELSANWFTKIQILGHIMSRKFPLFTRGKIRSDIPVEIYRLWIKIYTGCGK